MGQCNTEVRECSQGWTIASLSDLSSRNVLASAVSFGLCMICRSLLNIRFDRRKALGLPSHPSTLRSTISPSMSVVINVHQFISFLSLNPRRKLRTFIASVSLRFGFSMKRLHMYRHSVWVFPCVNVYSMCVCLDSVMSFLCARTGVLQCSQAIGSVRPAGGRADQPTEDPKLPTGRNALRKLVGRLTSTREQWG